ncbi:MAG TPA: helix-turn-helix domain-containing protein [Vicinamibacteria bacterium]|jgi:DNA-binding NtrC family response regulator
MTFKQRIDDYQRRLILEALAESGGNQRQAAARLGILPTTLCEKLKRLGLRPTSEPAPYTVEATE